jgi:WD40 repeat protein
MPMPLQIPRSLISLLAFPLLCTGCTSKPAGTAPPVVAEWTVVGEGDCVAFSKDGRFVAVGIATTNLSKKGRWCGVVEVYETGNARRVAQLPQSRWVHSVTFSPDGKYLACATGIRDRIEMRGESVDEYEETGGEVAVYETDKYTEVFRHKSKISPSECRTVAFHPKGAALYALTVPDCYADFPPGEARAWSVPAFKEQWTTNKPQAQYSDLAVSSDGSKVYVQDWESIRVLSSERGEVETTIKAGGQDRRLVMSGDGKRLAILTSSGHRILFLDLPEWKEFDSPAFDYNKYDATWVDRASLSPDGARVAVTGGARGRSDDWYHISVWDIKTGAKYYWETNQFRFNGLAYSADGSMFAACGTTREHNKGYLAVWKVPALK